MAPTSRPSKSRHRQVAISVSQSFFSARLYEEAAKSNVNEPAAPAGDDDDIVDAEIVDE